MDNKRRYGIGLLSITGLAFGLRWAYPTLVEFGFDEAHVSRLALFIAHYGYRPVFGVESSIGVRQFPLFLYLASLPLRLWPHPLAIVFFIAGLNALAVPLTYMLTRRYWGPRAALVAALLFAVNGWAVLYGRKIWVQNITLITVLFGMVFFRAFVDDRPWAWLVVWPAVAALIGLHLEGLAFVVIVLLAMVLRGRHVPWRWAITGIGLSALALSPYLIADARAGWRNVHNFWHYIGQSPGLVTLDAWQFALRLASGQALTVLAGQNTAQLTSQLPPFWLLDTGMGILSALGLLYALARGLKDRTWGGRRYVALVLWFVIPVLLQTYHTRPVYPRYFTILYPVPFMLVGALVAEGLPALRNWLSDRVVGWLRWCVGGWLGAWAVWQFVLLLAIWRFVDSYPTPGGFGTPLKYPWSAAEVAKATAGEGEIIVMAPAGELEWSVPRQMFDALLFTHERRFVNGQETIILPKGSVVYIVGPLAPQDDAMAATLTFLETYGNVQRITTIEDPNDQRFIVLRRTDGPQSMPPTFTLWTPPVRLANGVRFFAFAIRPVDHAWEVWLGWDIERVSEEMYRIYVHGLNAQGNIVALGDISGLLPYYRREGDRLFSRVVLPTSPNMVRIRVGMYIYPTQQRIPIVSPPAWAGKDGVTLSLAPQ